MGLRQVRKHGIVVDGWLVLDKPVGLRSTVAVGRVQSLLRARKCGHAGTLDPAAEGLLPLALGAATKTVSYAMDGRKVYSMVVRWGERRTTDDSEGEIEASSDARPSRAAIERLLPEFTGEILQRPPRFSALRIGGKRAYTLARQGEEVNLPARKVSIFGIQLLEMVDADKTSFSVEAGKGAYMRALARDLGERLGCFGRLESLRRHKVGSFTEEHAVSLERLEELFDRQDVSRDAEDGGGEDGGGEDGGEKYPSNALLSQDETLSRLGSLLLPVESALGSMARLTLEPWEQQQFCRGLGVLFVDTEQRERLASVGSDVDSIAVFAAKPSRRLLGVGGVQQGRLKALRLFSGSPQARSSRVNAERGGARKNVASRHDSV